jgi:hypothetical protein
MVFHDLLAAIPPLLPRCLYRNKRDCSRAAISAKNSQPIKSSLQWIAERDARAR